MTDVLRPNFTTHVRVQVSGGGGGAKVQDNIMLALNHTCQLAQKHRKDKCLVTLHHMPYLLNNSNQSKQLLLYSSKQT